MVGMVLWLALAPAAGAKVLGSVGATYAIAERDALEEIEARARAVDWRSVLGREEPENYRPPEAVRLPRARLERVFLVDLSWTLPFDVPDGKGGVLYPRGYSFNPLDYVSFGQTLVILDGGDPDQVDWFRNSGFARKPDVLLLLTEGSFTTVSDQLKRHVYYADRRITERFRLAAVPSVITRQGRLMEVREIALPIDSRR
jgi:conjugal transfer pilus assembly protein TraW